MGGPSGPTLSGRIAASWTKASGLKSLPQESAASMPGRV
ncbi:DUF6053 domain-containing protein [Lysobacter enzymogenes]